MGRKRRKAPGSLSTGRPQTLRTRSASLSRKAARLLISRHHALAKRKTAAAKRGDDEEAAVISAEIDALGGLPRYQQASLLGQSKDRGGDSSKVLLEWLRPFLRMKMHQRSPDTAVARLARPVKMLEVGALSSTNACSASPYFDVERIDLHSQEPGILRQDFMKRPLPDGEAQKFDIISLSLVLNFVPDAAGRGNMLRRTLRFLVESTESAEAEQNGETTPFPSVFVVLPRSCIANSRYLTEERFDELMTSLGFRKFSSRVTEKLAYSLWKRDASAQTEKAQFLKKQVNPGRSRNNFAIILQT